MAKTSTKVSVANKATGKAVAAVARGIHTARDLANVMAAMIEDLLLERVSTSTANAVSSASAKLLKIAELQYKHDRVKNGTRKSLPLAD